MIYNKKKAIPSVESYVIEQRVLFKRVGVLYQLNSVQEEELLPRVSDYFLRENMLFYQRENLGDVFVLNLVTKEQHKISGNYSIGSKIVFTEESFLVIGESSGVKKLYEIDYSFKVRGNRDYTFPSMLLAINQGIVFKKRGVLSVINIQNSKQLWSYELPTSSKIQNVEQIAELLVVQSNTNSLYGLDSQTGEKAWELSGVSYHHTYDAETGLLYSFGGETYRVIDPLEGKIIIEKQFEGAEEKYQISPQGHMHSISEGYLYFMSNWHETRFGAIDIKTHKIDFVQKLKVEEGVKGGIPQYFDNMLFVKDSLDTLHIFEKE